MSLKIFNFELFSQIRMFLKKDCFFSNVYWEQKWDKTVNCTKLYTYSVQSLNLKVQIAIICISELYSLNPNCYHMPERIKIKMAILKDQLIIKRAPKNCIFEYWMNSNNRIKFILDQNSTVSSMNFIF